MSGGGLANVRQQYREIVGSYTATGAAGSGAYSELVSSLPKNIRAIEIVFSHNVAFSGTTQSASFRLGKGTSGAEADITPPVDIETPSVNVRVAVVLFLELSLPAGTRLAYRAPNGGNAGGTKCEIVCYR